MPIIAAAIVGGAVIAGGVTSAKAAERANRRNVQFAQETQGSEIELANTAHQREVADLRAAGLNPILSAGGKGATTPDLQAPSVEPVDYGKGVAEGVTAGVNQYQSARMINEQVKTQQSTQKSLDAKANLDFVTAQSIAGKQPHEIQELQSRAGMQTQVGRHHAAETFLIDKRWERGYTAAQWSQDFMKGEISVEEAKQGLIQKLQQTEIGTSQVALSRVAKRVWEASDGQTAFLLEKIGVHGLAAMRGMDLEKMIQGWLGQAGQKLKHLGGKIWEYDGGNVPYEEMR